MRRVLAMVWPTLRSTATARLTPDPREAARFEAMLDRLDELSPRIQAPALGVALADITGLEALFGDEQRIAARAAALAGAEALPLHLGIGDNRWLATLAACRAGDGVAGIERIPSGDGRRWLAPLPIRLLPAERETRARLALFGLREIGQLADLPRSAVGAQLGAAGERLHQLARGEDPRPLVPRPRPESVRIDVPLDPPVEGLEGVAFPLRRACTDLCDTLARRHRAPGRASLELVLDDASARRWPAAPVDGEGGGTDGHVHVEIVLPQPVLEGEWIARLLGARLETAVRAGSVAGDADEPRVTGLRLTLDRLSDPWARQLPAFEPQAARWEELRWSLERMRSRFGPGRLRRALHERPLATLAERQARLVDIGLEADAP